MRALVTGATGFVGHRLLARLDQPSVLTRNVARSEKTLAPFGAKAFAWNVQAEPPPQAAFHGIDTVIHLAGDPVAEGRWNAAKRARIKDSRVLGTRNLVATLAALPNKPRVLVSASAIGYYGSRGDERLDERSAAGNDFLAEVCIEWEREAERAAELGIRVVLIRVGIVLGENGGALAKMLTPFYLGLGSPLGNGRQYMSWIHIDDLVEEILFAAREPQLRGPLNGVAPHPVTNREFTKIMGKVLKRPTFMPPVPKFVLKTMIGDFAEVLVASQRVYPQTPLAAGFAFKYPDLEPALRQILHRE